MVRRFESLQILGKILQKRQAMPWPLQETLRMFARACVLVKLELMAAPLENLLLELDALMVYLQSNVCKFIVTRRCVPVIRAAILICQSTRTMPIIAPTCFAARRMDHLRLACSASAEWPLRLKIVLSETLTQTAKPQCVK
jgi:hypothetical protein